MGILSSMYTGVTGLQGQGEALAIYGDNIANANTTGFKTSRPEFQDVVAKSLKGLLGGNQIGRGTRLASVSPVFSQGSLVQTESPTDLAISGDGFFTMKGKDGTSFSRAGTFRFDKEGKLTNTDGFMVQGFQADPQTGSITSKLGEISVDRTVIEAKGTEKVDLFLNLDGRANPLSKVFDPEKPELTSHFATGITIFDTAGAPRTVSLFFNRTDGNKWTWRAMAKGDEVKGGEPGKWSEQAGGSLTFDTDGRLLEAAVDKNEFSFNGAKEGQKVDFNFGSQKSTGGSGVEVTQFGAASQQHKHTQNGYSAGVLSGLTFNDDGTLAAIYSNGENVNVAQIALAKFENNEGLFKMGQNRFRESRNSGSPTIGAPQTGGRGAISAKTLELSTTDIASEFISLMNSQRNFQANSKVVSVADEMMQEVINLNRR
jgi:flagellar hook protein FlgE